MTTFEYKVLSGLGILQILQKALKVSVSIAYLSTMRSLQS